MEVLLPHGAAFHDRTLLVTMAENILNLPQYGILRVEESDICYRISAKPLMPLLTCPSCHSEGVMSWGGRERAFKDLHINGRPVSIIVNIVRHKCRACRHTFSLPLPAMAEGRGMTQRLVEWICQQCLVRSFTALAADVGVTEATIRNIFRDYIGDLEGAMRRDAPKWLGIQECQIINRQRPVLLNLQDGTIVDILRDCSGDALVESLLKMRDLNEMCGVMMNMHKPHLDAMRSVMPSSLIVVDKAHVVAMTTAAMTTAIDNIAPKLMPRHKRKLMRVRSVLLKQGRALDSRERLVLGDISPVLGDVYRLKEAFDAIYDVSRSPDEAERRYSAWCGNITDEYRPYFSVLLCAIADWQPYIFNYFDHPAPIVASDALANRLSDLGRGYSFDALRAQILLRGGS